MKIKFMIVEDDLILHGFYKVILNSDETEIVGISKNGKNGLKLFKSLISKNSKPNVIITDYKMPIMNGIDFIKEIRKIDNKIPIVMISGYDSIKEQALEVGASQFISKFRFIEGLQQFTKRFVGKNEL
jgi:YesN/AraC family two-component response regulator